MSEITLGIIGGGQLGSMLAISAKKLNIKTVIYCDDPDAPAQNFCNKFISGNYSDKEKIIEFVNLVNYVTYELKIFLLKQKLYQHIELQKECMNTPLLLRKIILMLLLLVQVDLLIYQE